MYVTKPEWVDDNKLTCSVYATKSDRDKSEQWPRKGNASSDPLYELTVTCLGYREHKGRIRSMLYHGVNTETLWEGPIKEDTAQLAMYRTFEHLIEFIRDRVSEMLGDLYKELRLVERPTVFSVIVRSLDISPGLANALSRNIDEEHS